MAGARHRLLSVALALLVAGAWPAATGGAAPRRTQVVSFTLHSALLHRALPELVVVPGGPAPVGPRPLLVLLHGRGATPAGWLLDSFFAGLAGLGSRAPDVLLVNGGDHSYFHDRGDGPWGTSVMREAIPAALQRTGADPARMAIGGISMGGFGAFDLARLNPGRFCAIGGHSAALWTSFGDSAPGAFDDAGDFARHDVIRAVRRRPQLFGDARIWLDGGTDDPFRAADEALAGALRTPYGPVHMVHYPGGHTGSYWHAHMARYLTFYGDALTSGACRARRRPVRGPTGASGPAGPRPTGASGPSGPRPAPGGGPAAPGGGAAAG